MKIRFLEDTNIRKTPHIVDNSPIGIIFKGVEMEVSNELAYGDAIQQIDAWYQDKNGWYFWSGMVEIIAEHIPPSSNALTGMIVLPPPIHENVPEPAVGFAQIVPADFPKDNADSESQTIPNGETRIVPSLAELLGENRKSGFVPGNLPKPDLQLEKESTPPAEVELPVVPVAPTPNPPELVDPEPIEVQGHWPNPTISKLNWAVRDYLIAEDWWQTRKLTGKHVSIAILSTGVAPNLPDLMLDPDQFAGINEKMSDQSGLGTQAAIIAAGKGEWVFGVAPEASILAAKLGEQDHLISPDRFMEGLSWAINEGADIIAMLVDFPELNAQQTSQLQALVNLAVERQILLVAPAGTVENKKPESRYPACLPGVLSVGAHNQYGERCSFSVRSYDLDIMAPGEGLITVAPQRANVVENLKSTAIAAAFVAGFLALIRQWQRENNYSMDPSELFTFLKETAAPNRKFSAGNNVEYGYGILNPIKILQALDLASQASQ